MDTQGRGNFDLMHCIAVTITSVESYSHASNFRPSSAALNDFAPRIISSTHHCFHEMRARERRLLATRLNTETQAVCVMTGNDKK